MNNFLIIIAVSFLFSGNANAKIINLKCVDDLEKSTLSLVLDTNKKIASIGESKFKVLTGENHYRLNHVDESITDTFIINRVTGGFNGRVFDKLWTLGTCFSDAELKF